MNETPRPRIQVFDPQQDLAIVQRRLPHWSQAGTVSFITWRTWDSIPQKILQVWRAERDAWLLRHGIDPESSDLQRRVSTLSIELQQEYQLHISDRWNDHLDACHGECVLRRPEIATIVADSLRYFDGKRYDLTDYVIMPNHVHLLVAFPDEHSMLAQCESWKHFTATRINRLLRRDGRFWQQDRFDHLVRSTEQFEYLRHYLAENPRKARLSPGEYLWESKAI